MKMIIHIGNKCLDNIHQMAQSGLFHHKIKYYMKSAKWKSTIVIYFTVGEVRHLIYVHDGGLRLKKHNGNQYIDTDYRYHILLDETMQYHVNQQ